MRKRPVNIKNVAAEAGVSAMTVSRVLNESPSVSKATREKVEETIRRLGYRPNAIARSLKAQRTNVLGLVTVDLTDSFFTQVTAGAEAEARRLGYRLMLSSTERNPQDEPDFIHMLVEQQVDGILVIRDSIEIQDDPLLGLMDIGIPIVTTGYHLPHPELEVVDIDNVDGGYQATRYLLERGHRQIAMITGPCNNKSAKARSEGYLKALREFGLCCDWDLVAEGDWKPRSGYQAMKALLERKKDFTALFMQSDEMAIDAYHAIHEAGLDIPKDLSVIGFDDLLLTEYMEPPLTSMRQPIFQIGELAIRLLAAKIAQPGIKPQEHFLKAQLVERSSVSALN